MGLKTMILGTLSVVDLGVRLLVQKVLEQWWYVKDVRIIAPENMNPASMGF